MADLILAPDTGDTLSIGDSSKPVLGVVTNGTLADPSGNNLTPLEGQTAYDHSQVTGHSAHSLGTAADLAATTSVGTPGLDTNLPTEKAVRSAIAAIPAGVTSWNTRTGAVVPQSGDYTASDVGADPAGTASAAISAHVGASDPHTQYQKESEKGNANGYASLDAGGKVPATQLPASVMEFKGAWDVVTNTPTLADGTGDTGDIYRASTAGTRDLGSGPQTWAIGDWCMYNGTIWQKSPATDAVTSVNTKTGAVTLVPADLGLEAGTQNLVLNTLRFNTSPTVPSHTEGTLYWDNQDRTLNVMTDVSGTVLQIGQEELLRATNETGTQINNGQVVYIDGAQGSRPTIALAQADAEGTSNKTIGVATANISDHGTGYVTTFGLVRDLDTDIVGWTEGDTLWLSATVAGGITNTRPAAPLHAVYLGTLVRKHPTQGVIFVNVQNGYELAELHDVSGTAPTDGQALVWNNSTKLWTPTSVVSDLSSAVILTPASSTRNVVQPTADYIPLTVKGYSSQTANLTEWQSSAGGVLASVSKDGKLTATGVLSDGGNIRVYFGGGGNSLLDIQHKGTGVETNAFINCSIYNGTPRFTVGATSFTTTLPTTITASAAGNIPLTVKGAAAQTANLQQWQNSGGAALASIDAFGKISAIAGTITAPGGGSSAFNIVSVVGHGGPLFTVEPLTGGYFTVQVDGKVGAGVYINPAARIHAKATAAAEIVSIFQGTTAQTADLQEWQDSAGTPLAYMDSNGYFTAGRVRAGGSFGTGGAPLKTGYYDNDSASNAMDMFNTVNSTAVNTGIAFRPGQGVHYIAAIRAYTNSITGAADNTLRFYGAYDYAGSTVDRTRLTEMLRIGTNYGTVVTNYGAAVVGLTVKGASAQTANLQEWQNDAGTKLAWVDSGGNMFMDNRGYGSSLASHAANNADLIIYGGTGNRGGTIVLGRYWASASDVRASAIYHDNSTSNTNLHHLAFAVSTGAGDPATDTQKVGAVLAVDGNAWGSSRRLLVRQTGAFGFMNNTTKDNYTDSDTTLFRDDANILALRNGTNPMTFRVYNTYTDASNYERARIAWNTNVLEIGTAAAGTGTQRAMQLLAAGVTVPAQDAAQIPLTVKGASSQTGNLQEWQSNAGAILAAISAAGGLSTGGARTVGVNSIATAGGTTVGAATDHVVAFTGTSTQTYTLPACTTGRQIIVKNRSTGNVTVARAGSDTIDGGTSYVLYANESVTLIGNGTDWLVC